METDGPFDVLAHYERYRNEEMIKYMPYRPGLRVLDCRCGRGMLLDQLAGRTAVMCGIDLSLPTLRSGRQPAQVVLARNTCLPFESCSFDVVFGDRALKHTPVPARLLDELARVLCPGGRMILWERRRTLQELETCLSPAGFVPLCEEPFGYFAYPTVVSTNQVPGLRDSEWVHALTKFMLALDGLLVRIPALRDKSWHRILVAEKRKTADGGSTDP